MSPLKLWHYRCARCRKRWPFRVPKDYQPRVRLLASCWHCARYGPQELQAPRIATRLDVRRSA